MTNLDVPAFASEEQEAQWWFDHQEELDDHFLHAAAQDELGVGRAAQSANIPTRFVELSTDDFEAAKLRAASRGVAYEAYLQDLIHTAISQDAAA